MAVNICPKCNNEIKEGQVYCEKCGTDIQFVPEFDARLDIEMDDALRRILNDINLDEMSEEDIENLTNTLDLGTTGDLRRKYRLAKTRDLKPGDKAEPAGKGASVDLDAHEGLRMWLMLVILVVTILMGVSIYRYMVYSGSYESLISRGDSAYTAGDLDRAADLYGKALAKEPLSEDAACKLATVMHDRGDVAASRDLLLSMISREPSTRLYMTLLDFYEKDGDYQSIASVAATCGDEEVEKAYRKYIALPPSFDREEGIYKGQLSLGLISNVPGHIYYTLDGSEPGVDSLEYVGPIVFSEGKNVVRAVFVNEMGVMSDSISGIFEVEKDLPDEPEVTPESGNYTKGGYVEVKAVDGCEIHYTTDGTMPGEDSPLYEYPLLMKQGSSKYRFVAIDGEGRRSNITSAQYTLTIPVIFSENDAVNCLLTAMLATGRIADINGMGPDGRIYRYKCNGMLTKDGFSYYIFEEYRGAQGSDGTPTGSFYSVEVSMGVLGQARRGSDGYFRLGNFPM